MVERVAIAMRDANAESISPARGLQASDWREFARAAIAAMREPTPHQMARAILAVKDLGDYEEAERPVARAALSILPQTCHPAAMPVVIDLARDYRAMIDAALEAPALTPDGTDERNQARERSGANPP